VVEKHFPAPDRKKFFDIFGLGNNSLYNNEDSNSSTGYNNNKRKKGRLEKCLQISFLPRLFQRKS
jgi:hypothetical protein